MKISGFVMGAACAIFAATAAFAQTAPQGSSGYPGDGGRIGNGLPLIFGPNGATLSDGTPLGPPPKEKLARSIAMDLALELAKDAVAACKGFHVGVTVLDAEGAPKLEYIPDGSVGGHAYTGFRKAFTALTFKMTSGEAGEAAKKDAAMAAKIAGDTRLLAWAGGVPILAGAELIGAVGVSGAEPSAKDEECAKAGLEKVKARIK